MSLVVSLGNKGYSDVLVSWVDIV